MSPGARAPDGGGGYTTGDPVTFAAGVRAAVEPLEGHERLDAMQTKADVTHRVRMRYRAGITSKMWIVHVGRTLRISGPPIDTDERHREMTLLCREEVV